MLCLVEKLSTAPQQSLCSLVFPGNHSFSFSIAYMIVRYTWNSWLLTYPKASTPVSNVLETVNRSMRQLSRATLKQGKLYCAKPYFHEAVRVMTERYPHNPLGWLGYGRSGISEASLLIPPFSEILAGNPMSKARKPLAQI